MLLAVRRPTQLARWLPRRLGSQRHSAAKPTSAAPLPAHKTRASTRGGQRALLSRRSLRRRRTRTRPWTRSQFPRPAKSRELRSPGAKNPRPMGEAGVCVIEMTAGYDAVFGLGAGVFAASSAFLAAGQQAFASAAALSQVPIFTFSPAATLDLSQAALSFEQAPSPACNASDTATTLRSITSFFMFHIR